MKKMICFLLLTAMMQHTIAQTETFDIATYTPPQNFNKEEKPGGVVYSQANDSTGKFCAIIIFASTAGTGDVAKDFKLQWDELAVKKYAADAKPATEKAQTPNGWKTITGASAIKIQGTDAYIVLTVFSGFGKRVSVVSTLNDQAFLVQLDAFLETIKLDKTKSVSQKTIPPDSQKNDTQKINAATSYVAITGDGKFGHMLFTPMKDWDMKRYTNGIIFKPSNLPDNRYIETRIMQSKPFSGSMQEALETSWNDALNELQVVSPYTRPYYYIIKEKKSFRGWDYIQCEGTVKKIEDHDDLSYDKYYINLFVIKLNDRIERIVTVGLRNINGSDYSPYNNSAYRDPIQELCLTLRFDDWKEETVGALKGNALSGMYGGLKLGGGNLNASYALFFPNGQVFFGEKFPTTGFDGKNTWVYAELNTRNWGTYTLQDGKGTINMGYGKMPLKVVGTNLVITTQNTEHTYEKFPSLDGAVFNGKYAFDGDWGGKLPSVTFTLDGKFIDEGALNILNHQTTDPDEFNITAKPGNGTYEIKNYTLVFRYSDGRKVQMVFTGNGFDRKNPSPASLTLSFNDDILYKK